MKLSQLRNFASQLNLEKVLESLHIRATLPAPKEELPQASYSYKFQDNPTAPPPPKDSPIHSAQFAALPNEALKLPARLQELNREWDTASAFVESYYNERIRKYIEIGSEISPPGIFHVEGEANVDEIVTEEEMSYYIKTFCYRNPEIARKRIHIPPELLAEPDLSQVKMYPGSPKGPEIEDDPEHWAEWYVNNQPKVVEDMLGRPWKPQDSLIVDTPRFANSESYDPDVDIERRSGHQDPTLTFLNADFKPEKYVKTSPEEDFVFNTPELADLTVYSPLEDPNGLPVIPPNIPFDVHGHNVTFEKWSLFRMVPQLFHQLEHMDKELEAIENAVPAEKQVTIPSVFNYYEMLPNYYKEHRLVSSIALCLDRYKPEMTRKQKELFLNRLCNLITPRDPQKYLFLQEAFTKKYSPPTDDEVEETVDSVTATTTEQTVEENDALKMLGEEAKEGTETIYHIAEIPDFGIDWFTREHENPDGLVPSTITYYDNDDGYWDDWITRKREKYGMPDMDRRPYFKH